MGSVGDESGARKSPEQLALVSSDKFQLQDSAPVWVGNSWWPGFVKFQSWVYVTSWAQRAVVCWILWLQKTIE